MKKYISVPNNTKRDLKVAFECTREMVWQALNYKSDSKLARQIRKVAIDKGGVVYDEGNQKFTNLSK
ncbi:MAG: hypothetical protein LBV18_03875 [Alistipes sp.]|nr:hypothetical protein [Alistipes sp.]